MDPTAGEQQEAPAPSDRGASPTTSELVVRRHAPLSEVVVAGGSDAAEGSDGGVEDEQVERFYALLANIRDLRDIYGGGGSWRKRARGSTEPPWRPAFTMENFQCARKKKRRDGGAGRQHPEKASDDEDGREVVEEEKVRVSASRRARAPARQSTKQVVESKECVGTSDVSSP